MHAVRASNADPCRMFVLAYAAWPLIAFVAQSETCAFHESMRNAVSSRSHFTSQRTGLSLGPSPFSFLVVGLLIVLIT